VAGFVALGVMAFAGSAWSHHAHGNYQREMVDMEGVVSEVHLLAPHSWVYIEVTKDGQKQMWALEGGGGGRPRPGVTTQTLKAGDTIKVRCQPLTDGTPGCLLGFIKTSDGMVKDWDNQSSTNLPKDF
jgi:hypothetical protein